MLCHMVNKYSVYMCAVYVFVPKLKIIKSCKVSTRCSYTSKPKAGANILTPFPYACEHVLTPVEETILKHKPLSK